MTCFDMTVFNGLDSFHLVLDAISRMSQLCEKGKKLLENKLIVHRKYIDKNGLDMPEVRNWKWKN